MQHSDNLIDDISDHHKCLLGKWYYDGKGQSLYSNLPSFNELDNMETASDKVMNLLTKLGNDINSMDLSELKNAPASSNDDVLF